MNRAYCERISKQLEKDCGRLLSERDCMDLAEDVCLVMELNKFRRPVVEWLNGKMQFTDVIVNGFSLVQVASALNQRRPNIPVAALLLYLEETKPDPFRAISAVAHQPCAADQGVLEGKPCAFAVRADEKWFFFSDGQCANRLRECQMWQILLLNPRLTLQIGYEHPNGTALILQEDGSYLIVRQTKESEANYGIPAQGCTE